MMGGAGRGSRPQGRGSCPRGVDHVPGAWITPPEGPTNYLANRLKETLRLMTANVPPRDWTEIHWPGIPELQPSRWIAVLPLAATEQHGPHLPLGTDVMIAQAYLAQARELLADSLPATFLPVQPVGISTEHTDYPGTLTLPTEVALKSWMALG